MKSVCGRDRDGAFRHCGSFCGLAEKRERPGRARRRRHPGPNAVGGKQGRGDRVRGRSALQLCEDRFEMRADEQHARIRETRAKVEIARRPSGDVETALDSESCASGWQEKCWMPRHRRRQGSCPWDRLLAFLRVAATGYSHDTRGLRAPSNRSASAGAEKTMRDPIRELKCRYSDWGMSDKYQRLLDQLVQSDGWVTARELADQLGVTTRSVRSYVTAAKAAAHPLADHHRVDKRLPAQSRGIRDVRLRRAREGQRLRTPRIGCTTWCAGSPRRRRARHPRPRRQPVRQRIDHRVRPSKGQGAGRGCSDLSYLTQFQVLLVTAREGTRSVSGDNFLAVFGLRPHSAHAESACRAANVIRDALPPGTVSISLGRLQAGRWVVGAGAQSARVRSGCRTNRGPTRRHRCASICPPGGRVRMLRCAPPRTTPGPCNTICASLASICSWTRWCSSRCIHTLRTRWCWNSAEAPRVMLIQLGKNCTNIQKTTYCALS